MRDTSPQEGKKKIPPEHIDEQVWFIWAMASEQTQIPKEIRAHRTLHTHLKEMRMSSFHLHSGATNGKLQRNITCVANFSLWTPKHWAYPTVTSLSFLSWEASTHLFIQSLIQQIFIEPLLWVELCSNWGHSSEKNKIFTFGELAFLNLFFCLFFLVSR